jgi:transcriptional regulator with XRE-family HTH domain
MDSASILRTTRLRAGLTLRDLAARAATSHSTLAAYESGRKVPSVATFDRIIRATGHVLEVDTRQVTFSGPRRGDELAEVLRLAAMFPARHTPHLNYPIFGR